MVLCQAKSKASFFVIKQAPQNSNFCRHFLLICFLFPGHFHKAAPWTVYLCSIEIFDIFNELSQAN